jgi:hypothetical protein
MKDFDKNIIGKWKEILEAEEAPKITNSKVKRATAIMLENQVNYLIKNNGLNEQALNETTSQYSQSITPDGNDYSVNGFFNQVAIPMVRRTFPELIAHEICGVQPMNQPVGLAFAMRFIADDTYNSTANTELGHNTVDSAYTGSHVTSTGEALGSDVTGDVGLGIGSGTAIKEVSMTLEKAQVEAKTRKLRSRWSLEVAQDVENMHGLNLEDEMMDVLSYEITAEIDREIIAEMRSIAASSSKSYDTDFDGRWESEKYRNLYNVVVRESNQIAINTRRGPGNFVVANPTICAALEALAGFATHPLNTDTNTALMGVSRLGYLDGRMSLYRDTFQTADKFLVGYKGPSEYDTGIVYMPYVQLMMSRTVDYGSFNPAIGLLSRYGIHGHIFGASNYYRQVLVNDMP